jgi:hypothetical protein
MRGELMIRQRNIQAYLQGEGVDFGKEDIFVNITLYRVPGDLVREFGRRVVVNYPGGLSEAVQDLMRRALKE